MRTDEDGAGPQVRTAGCSGCRTADGPGCLYGDWGKWGRWEPRGETGDGCVSERDSKVGSDATVCRKLEDPGWLPCRCKSGELCDE